MSNTATPNATTKQSLTAATMVTDKQKDLRDYVLDPMRYPDGHTMTTNWGAKIGNDDSTLKAGPRGPTLMEDFHFREKMTHFDHERIPERVVHARGAAAHGFFQVYDDSLSKYTTAPVLTDPSRVTSTFVRFSTVLGSRGSADTVRDVRGFATRFYAQEGNWDLVGNNIPVFFIQDALKSHTHTTHTALVHLLPPLLHPPTRLAVAHCSCSFPALLSLVFRFPDLIHAGKPEPHNEIPQGQTAHDNFWDYISLTPESTHMIMWILSDRTIPRSYRTMQGFGVNTFVLVNAQRQRTFVKFHWRPILGVHSLTWDECLKINGTDPDFHRRDLYDAIDNGGFPEYEFGVQLVPEADEDKFDFDLLDCTKLIPEEQVPVQWVGKMVLNKNVDEYFTETEQVAFCTQNVVPGIDFSNDPMLLGRNMSYLDTQLLRLGGPNFQQIPINRPICPVMNFQRDGYNQRIIHAGKINYYPNRQQIIKPGNALKHSGDITEEETRNEKLSYEDKELQAIHANAFVTYGEKMQGMKTRARGPKFQEHLSQAELFFNSMSTVEKTHITNAAIFELGHVDDLGVRSRIIDRLNLVNHQLALTVAQNVGIPAPKPSTRKMHGKSSPALSQLNTAFASIRGRKVAILVADGYDQSQMAAVYTAIKTQGAVPQVVSIRKGTIYSSNHPNGQTPSPPVESKEEKMDFSAVDAVWSIFFSKSILFDATIILDGAQSIATLSQYGETTGWVAETYKHYKAILAIGAGIQLLQAANLDRLSKLELASEASGNNAVNSHGVVSVYSWSATAPPKDGGAGAQEEKETTVGSVIQTVTTAVTSAIGAATGAKMSHYMPNDAAAQFFDAMKNHRDWTRDVARVPA